MHFLIGKFNNFLFDWMYYNGFDGELFTIKSKSKSV